MSGRVVFALFGFEVCCCFLMCFFFLRESNKVITIKIMCDIFCVCHEEIDLKCNEVFCSLNLRNVADLQRNMCGFLKQLLLLFLVFRLLRLLPPPHTPPPPPPLSSYSYSSCFLLLLFFPLTFSFIFLSLLLPPSSFSSP